MVFQLRSLDEIEVPLGRRVFVRTGLSPLRGWITFRFTHGLRRGLHSCAASRLGIRRSCCTANPRIEFSTTDRSRTFSICPEMDLFSVNRMPACFRSTEARQTILGESGKNFIETGKQAERQEAILLEARSLTLLSAV